MEEKARTAMRCLLNEFEDLIIHLACLSSLPRCKASQVKQALPEFHRANKQSPSEKEPFFFFYKKKRALSSIGTYN